LFIVRTAFESSVINLT